MSIFRKKDQNSQDNSRGSMFEENYVPSSLPKHGHPDLADFITSAYSLTSKPFLEDTFKACEDDLTPLVQITDIYTLGHTCDVYIDAQMDLLANQHLEEVAMHELQGQNIAAARKIRREELDRLIQQSEERIGSLDKAAEPLRGKHAQFDLRFGKICIPLGLPITLIALVSDAFLNYSFLEGILLQSIPLLFLTVLCLSIMSDGSMFVLGSLLSRKNEDFMGKWLYRISAAGLLSMFLLSVVAGVMVRVGSMDITYGTLNADGQFVGKEVYSLAEYGITLATSFLTTTTGLISLVFSVDKNARAEKRCKEIEAELAAETARCKERLAERTALDLAVDPMIRDLECRKAAEANLEALRTSLKLHIRKLLALHQQDANYTDAMSESAEKLLEKAPEEIQTAVADTETDATLIHLEKEAV